MNKQWKLHMKYFMKIFCWKNNILALNATWFSTFFLLDFFKKTFGMPLIQPHEGQFFLLSLWTFPHFLQIDWSSNSILLVEIVVHILAPHSEICIVSQKPKFPTSWSFRKQLSRGSCSLFKRHQEITRLNFPLTLDNGEWQQHRTPIRFKAKGNGCALS